MPEGRTRRRPETLESLLLYSRSRFLAAAEDLRLSFWDFVAGRFTMTWGSFVMMFASLSSGVLVVAMILASIREVRMPSPVGSPGKMMWPDCSPPRLMFCSRIAAATLESPTAVISVFIFAAVAQLRRP